jgi:hypothetical protein
VIINRHNYEAFFLLYVDNELEADERAAVDSFVSQNPDLIKELELLQQVTLADENIQFTSKEVLYKKESGISLADYQEYFLLFADNELNEQEAAEVENFVLKHPQLQDEFSLLQKVRLEPEPIAFAGKQKLYRRERNERRIILLSLARMGVAAAIAGAVYLSFVLYSNKNSVPDAVVHTTHSPAEKGLKNIDSSLAQKTVAEKANASLPPKAENKVNAEKVVARTRKPEKNIAKKFKETKKPEESIADNKLKEVKKETPSDEKNLALIEESAPEQKRVEENKTGKGNNDNNFDVVNHGMKDDAMIDKPVAKEQKPLVSHAVYLETDDVEQEKTLYIGSAQINKNKVKGFLKKAATFLDKKIRGNEN